MKKILILILSVLLIGSMAFGATESAQVIITTSVGETTANSGIKVVETYTGTTATAFDTAFFSAGSVITLATEVDTSTTAATGGFVVMVRRPTGAPVEVTVSGTTMASGTSMIPYTISEEESRLDGYVESISSDASITASYNAITVIGSILRDAKAFTYNIPVSALAPLGTYSATITFSITVE